MADRSPQDVSAAMDAEDRVAQSMNMTIDSVEAGSAAVSMTVVDAMTNGLGVCHGGIVFTLADTAMAHASNAGDERTVSTTATIDWIAAAHVGDRLTASSRVVGARGRNAIHDIEVVNQHGDTVALVRGQTLTLGGTVSRP